MESKMFNIDIYKARKIIILLLTAMLFILIASPSFAGTAIGWEGETILEKLADSLSGPIARNLAIISLVIGIGGLMMHGIDFSSWGGRLTWIFLGIAVVCFAKNWLDKVGVTGALIN